MVDYWHSGDSHAFPLPEPSDCFAGGAHDAWLGDNQHFESSEMLDAGHHAHGAYADPGSAGETAGLQAVEPRFGYSGSNPVLDH